MLLCTKLFNFFLTLLVTVLLDLIDFSSLLSHLYSHILVAVSFFLLCSDIFLIVLCKCVIMWSIFYWVRVNPNGVQFNN
jgi:hypothetical protein